MPDQDNPELGEMPEPQIEPGEENPGGVDAISDETPFGGDERKLGHDLLPDSNPAVEEQVPDEITQPDDKKQEPEKGESGEDDTETENPE